MRRRESSPLRRKLEKKLGVTIEKGDELVSHVTTFHHSDLYIGQDTVIGYHSGFPKKKIGKRSIDEVEVYKNCGKDPNTQYSNDEIVERAESRLGESNYKIVNNNCQTFVHWCQTGDSKSYNIEEIKEYFSSDTGVSDVRYPDTGNEFVDGVGYAGKVVFKGLLGAIDNFDGETSLGPNGECDLI